MVNITIVGGDFYVSPGISTSMNNKNKYVSWGNKNNSNISIHCDHGLHLEPDNTKLNFGWLLESSDLITDLINHVIKNLETYKKRFKYIFTHDERIISKNPDFFKFTIPTACSYINLENRKIYEKSKLCSAIISSKDGLPGHKYRTSVMNQYVEYGVDWFGRGLPNELPFLTEFNGLYETGKILGLKDYKFSFCFENSNYNNYFTEKITDCFATGTIPIYWGAPNIKEYFNEDGIIFFNNDFNYSMLTDDYYNSKKIAIEENLSKSINLLTAEDFFFENHIEKLI